MKRWLFLPSSVHKDIEALGRLRAEEVEKLKKILDSEAGKSRYAIYLQIVEELGVPDQDAARLHSFWEYARDEQTKHDKPAADVINEFVKALASSKEDHLKGVSRHIQENRSSFESLFGDYLKLEQNRKSVELEAGPIPHLCGVKSYCDVRPVYNKDGSEIVNQVAMITLRLSTHSEHLNEYKDVLIVLVERDIKRLGDELRRIDRKLAAIKKKYPDLTVPEKAHKGRKAR